MNLRYVGPGEWKSYNYGSFASVEVEWFEDSTTRTPKEKTNIYKLETGFEVNGKWYENVDDLSNNSTEYFGKDIYDREVFTLAMRFPTFDYYDSLYERRYYRCFFFREENRLTRVYYEDEDNVVYVTTDVAYIEEWCWDSMLEQGYCQENNGDVYEQL